jgi:hypothetical protein
MKMKDKIMFFMPVILIILFNVSMITILFIVKDIDLQNTLKECLENENHSIQKFTKNKQNCCFDEIIKINDRYVLTERCIALK